MAVRVEGLVAAARAVKAKLERGVAEEERAEFREAVREVVQRVREVCDVEGSTPEDLPGPSRAAWEYLRDLDLENLPAPAPGGRPAPARARAPGLVAAAARLAEEAEQIEQDLGGNESARRSLAAQAEEIIRQVRESLEEQGASLEDLPPRSRAAYDKLTRLANPVL